MPSLRLPPFVTALVAVFGLAGFAARWRQQASLATRLAAQYIRATRRGATRAEAFTTKSRRLRPFHSRSRAIAPCISAPRVLAILTAARGSRRVLRDPLDQNASPLAVGDTTPAKMPTLIRLRWCSMRRPRGTMDVSAGCVLPALAARRPTFRVAPTMPVGTAAPALCNCFGLAQGSRFLRIELARTPVIGTRTVVRLCAPRLETGGWVDIALAMFRGLRLSSEIEFRLARKF
ncbi:MAG: hypothetical protein JO172_02775 [Hyphomicrobiales bacterium]|nr:hypothetical protein [Hyphomicrobiales bacterium]